MRHHMIDAAIISHIPPGKGMNYAPTGIFRHKPNSKEGDISMEALPGLGPDLPSFEAENKQECLVCESRRTKSKARRFDETIYGLPDKDGNMMARVELSSWWLGLMKSKKDASPEKILDYSRRLASRARFHSERYAENRESQTKRKKRGFRLILLKKWWENCVEGVLYGGAVDGFFT